VHPVPWEWAFMTQQLLFGEFWALVVAFPESGRSPWIKLFDTEDEAKQFGIDWLIKTNETFLGCQDLDGMTLDEKWFEVETHLDFSEWMFVEPVEVLPRKVRSLCREPFAEV
jgi:hypothetical protein